MRTLWAPSIILRRPCYLSPVSSGGKGSRPPTAFVRVSCGYRINLQAKHLRLIVFCFLLGSISCVSRPAEHLCTHSSFSIKIYRACCRPTSPALTFSQKSLFSVLPTQPVLEAATISPYCAFPHAHLYLAARPWPLFL